MLVTAAQCSSPTCSSIPSVSGSIRQHTSAYVSIRQWCALSGLSLRHFLVGALQGAKHPLRFYLASFKAILAGALQGAKHPLSSI